MTTAVQAPATQPPLHFVSHVLELVLGYVTAHASKNVRLEHRYLSELRLVCQPFAKLEARNVEPVGYLAGAFGDDVGYDVAITDDDKRMCLRVYEALGRDAAIAMTVEQAAQVRRDLLRVMLRIGGEQ